jgi:hypothetical protein
LSVCYGKAILRNKMICGVLCAQVGDFRGGPGTLAIPTKTAGSVGTWVTEGTSPGA